MGDVLAFGRTPASSTGSSWSFERGEVVRLSGPNGSGKTTLAGSWRACSQPDSGQRRSARHMSATCRRIPGRYLVRERVDDEVALGVGGDRERARRALGLVGLDWAADGHPRDLSSGERERLGLAAVAVSEPELLVLDEPTRGIDPERKAELADWLHRVCRGGNAVLVVTHDVSSRTTARAARRTGVERV